MGADLTAITEALVRLFAVADATWPRAAAGEFVAERVAPLIAEARRQGAAELAARTQLALDDALAEQHATKAKSYSTRTFLGAIARISNDLTKPPAVSGEPTIHDLIERSSLGTPEAKAARESVPLDVAQRIVERSKELSAEPHRPGPDDDGVRYCERCDYRWPCPDVRRSGTFGRLLDAEDECGGCQCEGAHRSGSGTP